MRVVFMDTSTLLLLIIMHMFVSISTKSPVLESLDRCANIIDSTIWVNTPIRDSHAIPRQRMNNI